MLEGKQGRENLASTLDCALIAHRVLFQMNRQTEGRWAEIKLIFRRYRQNYYGYKCRKHVSSGTYLE